MCDSISKSQGFFLSLLENRDSCFENIKSDIVPRLGSCLCQFFFLRLKVNKTRAQKKIDSLSRAKYRFSVYYRFTIVHLLSQL